MYINNERNPRTFDNTPGSGQAVTGLHLSLLRRAGPLAHNIVTHMTIAGQRLGKRIREVTHLTIDGHPLLGIGPINTHS
jgi:hypothetical protein